MSRRRDIDPEPGLEGLPPIRLYRGAELLTPNIDPPDPSPEPEPTAPPLSSRERALLTQAEIAEAERVIAGVREEGKTDFRTRLSTSQQAEIIVLRGKSIGVREIARIVGCSHPTVIGYLRKYANTVDIAKATMKAGAQTLAERVIEKANVDQSLEVLDRLDALPKKRNDAGGAPAFNIMIGGVVQQQGQQAPHPPAPLDAEFEVQIEE